MHSSKKQKVVNCLGDVLVADAREAGEPRLYYFSLNDAPGHMKKQMKKSPYCVFEFLTEDCAESLMGLVNEDSEEADDRAEEIWEYLNTKCVHENKFNPSTDKSIDYSLTLAEA